MSHLDGILDPKNAPKKLLAIDGGGIRGLIAIEFLSEVERVLRDHFARPDLVLANYFDYIGGTSTGAIIATLLSWGYPVSQIRDFYKTGGKTMFQPANMFAAIARRSRGKFAALMGALGIMRSDAIFTQKALEAEIKTVLGTDTQLGSEKLRTLLLIVMRNASTDSPWPISNNPNAQYNATVHGSNLQLPLWQLIRASTAAPVFFPPEVIQIPDTSKPTGLSKPFVFMDGGITVYNNPAFQLFLMATLPTYRLGWSTGEREMLLVSVGTGLCESANLHLGPQEMNLLYNVQSTPAALMRAATVEQDTLCRIFGRARPTCNPRLIDREIGSLIYDPQDLQRLLAPALHEKLFSYARYNVELSDAGLKELGLGDIPSKEVQPLDSVDHLDELERVGKAAAVQCVSIDDFEDFLDPSTVRAS